MTTTLKKHRKSNVVDMERMSTDVTDFTGYEAVLNGDRCRFLNKEYQFILKMSVNQMSLSQFDSIVLFDTNEEERSQHIHQIQKLLNGWGDGTGLDLVNPFAYTFDDEGKMKPIFLPLASLCVFYKKSTETGLSEKSARPAVGKCFSGRVAIVVKGVKYSQDGKQMTPIMSVAQILEYPHVESELEVDKVGYTCLLDEDVKPPSNDVIPTPNDNVITPTAGIVTTDPRCCKC
jgi:hypothetical protein